MPVALVTGGAKRVGRAIVEKLAHAGFTVAFTYNSSATAARRLEKSLGAIAIQADFSQPIVACNQVFKIFSKRFHELHVLVNSASIYQPGDSVELLQSMMAIHVETPLLLCRKFEKHLRRSRGHVVNMIDILAERPWPQYLAYCASKAALANLTLSLARKLAPQVTVNGIAPGVVEWPTDYPASQRRKYLQRVPLKRAGTAADVANLVHFLSTDGSYITGQIIRLDGGRSLF
jgi:pteridine reductase